MHSQTVTESFSQSVIEQLGHYVYLLKDPREGRVFYVGQGVGNRVFHHLACSIETQDGSEKLDTIRQINALGMEVEHVILRHGLNEREAFEVEAAAIDLLGMSNLTNIQCGHNSGNFGLQTSEDIRAMYESEDFDPGDVPVLLINLNRLYDRSMSAEDLYEATRKAWVVGERRESAKYAIATFRGLTREVYSIHRWYPVPEHGLKRWAFEGELAPEAVRQEFRYKSIAKYFKKGAANPVKYLGPSAM